MKCFRKLWLSLLLVLSLLSGLLTVQADGLDTSSGLDVVIVVDNSGSMKYADAEQESERIVPDAAKLFVDMMESSGSRVGLVPFSDQLGTVLNLTAINSSADKDVVKQAISSMVYAGDTDIGLAIQKAVEMLTTAADVGNKKMILFFSDGAIDLPQGGDTAAEEQAETNSRSQAESAIATAASAGIPIYTVGLNANGSVDTELITKMSADTGAHEPYIVNSAEALPEIFNQIFADFIESVIDNVGEITIQDSEQYENVKFNIPNDSVLEANIIMLSTAKLSDVALLDPSGATKAVDGQNVVLSINNQYSMLKLFSPQSGEWTLQVKGEQGCQVKVNLLCNYEVILKAEAAEKADGTGVTVSAHLENKGVALTEDGLYTQLTKTVARASHADGTVTEIPMTYASGTLTCDVPVAEGESVTITAYAESDTMYRESDPITYTMEVKQDPPAITSNQIPSPIVLKGLIAGMTGEKLDLGGYFTTNTGNSLTYATSSSDPSVAGAAVNGSELSIDGAKNGKTTVTVEAADPAGVTSTQTVEVEVSAVFGSIVPLLIIAGVILLLIILVIVFILTRPHKLDGYLYWYMDDGKSFGSSNEEEVSLGFLGTKSTFSELVTDPSVAYAGLEKVTVKAIKRGGITIQCASKSCELMDSIGESKKKLDVRDQDTFEIVCNLEEGEIRICCRYQDEPQD